MSQARQKQGAVALDLLSVVIVVLACATALIHFLLGLALGPPGAAPFPLLFYLNALGYLVLVIALFAPALFRFRRVVRWMLILYTALTFALWFVLAPQRSPMGYLDKVLEAVLVILLLIDDRRAAPERAALPGGNPRSR